MSTSSKPATAASSGSTSGPTAKTLGHGGSAGWPSPLRPERAAFKHSRQGQPLPGFSLPGSTEDRPPAVVAATAAATVGGLPCQNSDNSILRDLVSPAAAKRLFTVRENVKALVANAGFNNVGFLTLTFKGGCPDIRVAQKRFNSFATNVLRAMFGAWICVVERHRKGGVHFHLVVDTLRDIRTDKDGRGVFDFDAVKRRDYRSANDALRGLWRFFREKAKDYGFGERAIELLPIRVSANAVGNYVGKYLTKHLANRRLDDRRKKMVRYSKGANRYRQQFSWATPGATLWRAKIGVLARSCGGTPDNWRIREHLGPRWAHRLKPVLLSMRAYEEPGRLPEFGIEELTAVFAIVQGEKCREQRRKPPDRQKSNWRRLAVEPGVFRTLEKFQQAFVHSWSEIEPGTALDLWCASQPDEWWEGVAEACNPSLLGEGWTVNVRAGLRISTTA